MHGWEEAAERRGKTGNGQPQNNSRRFLAKVWREPPEARTLRQGGICAHDLLDGLNGAWKECSLKLAAMIIAGIYIQRQ